jgi:hypothetical protein
MRENAVRVVDVKMNAFVAAELRAGFAATMVESRFLKEFG